MASIKCNYPLPNIEMLLQKVNGLSLISMLELYLDIIKYWLQKKIGLKLLSSHPGRHMHMYVCPLA
jgi:hypothetical protein